MIAGNHRPDAEVPAQGFANIASLLFGGMPATCAIARTATSIRIGGKTPVAGLAHAAMILIVMMPASGLAGNPAAPPKIPASPVERAEMIVFRAFLRNPAFSARNPQ